MATGTLHGCWIKPAKRLAIYNRDHGRCVYCKCILTVTGPTMGTLDHVQPRSEGGKNDATNLVSACHRCNSNRQSMPVEAWVRRLYRGTKVNAVVAYVFQQANLSLDLEAAKAQLAARKAVEQAA